MELKSFKFYLSVFIHFSSIDLEIIGMHISSLTVCSSPIYLKRVLTLFRSAEKIFSFILSDFLCDIDRDTNIVNSTRVIIGCVLLLSVKDDCCIVGVVTLIV